MSKKYAVRTISHCTKDCLCLYVCPTGASDTENSVIDIDKCIGCGACAQACPSGAITLVPREYPPQQKHDEKVIKAMRVLLASKSQQESMASAVGGKLAKAIEKSNRIMAEDIIRESGYMLPQSGNTNEFLISILLSDAPQEVKDDAKTLIKTLKFNEDITPKRVEKWRCSICQHVHEGALPQDFKCPICKQPASAFVKQ